MAYEYKKITTEDTKGLGNVGQPDTPNLPTGEMQALLDGLPNKIIEKYNELIEALNEHAGKAIQSDAITNLRFTQNGFEFSTDGGQTWGDAGSVIEVNATINDILMSNYVIASKYTELKPTENLATALGKLEAGVADNAQYVDSALKKVAKTLEIVSFDENTGTLTTKTMS